MEREKTGIFLGLKNDMRMKKVIKVKCTYANELEELQVNA